MFKLDLEKAKEPEIKLPVSTDHQKSKRVPESIYFWLIDYAWILSPCLFKLYAEYIMRNAGLEEAQAGIKIVGEVAITSNMQMTLPLRQKVKN